MMAKTLRDQLVVYAAPNLSRRVKRAVQYVQSRGERITISSLVEDMVREKMDEMEKRLGVPTQEPLRRVR